MTDCIIPEGYKKTSLGVIPKEWEAVRIHEICTLVNGRAYKQNELLSEGKYKILRVGNFFTNDSWYFSDLELEANKYACKGDLLYAWSASFGPRFWTEEKVIYHYHIWKICDLKGVDKQYLYFFLDYDASLLQNAIQGGTMHHITKNDMEKRFIPLPPMEEQQNIAKVLNTWDKAIEKQTQLIEKLELRKKGLMQQLLTGKKRLSGFGGEWKKVKLGDVAYIVGGGTPDTDVDNYWDGSIPWFTPTEIGEEKYVVASKRCITMDGVNNSSAKILPVGAILFTSRASIGLKAISLREATTNQGFQSLIVNKDNNTEYIYYLLDIIKNKLIRNASGSTFLEISSISMKNVAFEIPELMEQIAIANILSLCDNEILLAKQKLNKFRLQKKGLMQVLLTGIKRVNI